MNAVVFALLCLELSESLVCSYSGAVKRDDDDRDRQRRSLADKDQRCGVVDDFLRGKRVLVKSTSNAQQMESLSAVETELKICIRRNVEPRYSCCTSETEHHLQVFAFDDMRQLMSSSMTPVRHELIAAIKTFSGLHVTNSATFFDFLTDEFRLILQTFENTTFHILANTFRIPKPQVQLLLSNLISRLFAPSSAESRHQLTKKVIGEFYNDLFITAVHNLLKFNVSDDSREGKRCLTELRQDATLMPFGTYPSLFEQHFQRSLGAASTFAWGLQVISDYLNVTVILDLARCLQSVTMMTYCSLCQGVTDAVPCPIQCTGALRGCLQPLLAVASSIRKFAGAIDSVKAELSAVTVFDAILPSMVSESLLKVIETGHTYRSQIVKKCGFRRSYGSRSLSSSSFSSGGAKTLTDGATLRQSLERLMRILLRSSDLLSALPKTFCTSRKSSDISDDRCWNGTSLEPQKTEVEERYESDESSKDKESASQSDTAMQLNEITLVIHRRTDARKSQPIEEAEATVDFSRRMTQQPSHSRPVKDDNASADDEDDAESGEDNDNRYSGGESGEREKDDKPTMRMKTTELTSRRPEATSPPKSSYNFIRHYTVTIVLSCAVMLHLINAPIEY